MRIQDMPARERITRARSALVTNPAYAFFGCLALSLRLQEVTWTETLAVDGETLFYNAAFVQECSESDLLFCVAHEVMHLARLHHVRRNGRDLETWNRATDYTINPDLVKAGLRAPKGALVDSRFEGMGAEQVFSTLEREARQQEPQSKQEEQQDSDNGDGGDDAGQSGAAGDDEEQESGSSDGGDGGNDAGDGDGDADGDNGQPGDGPAARNAPDPGQCGGVIDAAPDASSMNDKAAEMEARVRQAVSVARAANAGTTPGFLERLIDELNAPRVSWRDELREFVNSSATRALAWERPNKRFLRSSFYMPGKRRDGIGKVAAVVDSSGSIDAATLSAFRDELQGILDGGNVDSLVVIYCHQSVHDECEFERGDVVTLDVKQTGGTLFGPALRHMDEQHGDAAAIVYLTDLEPAAYHPDGWGQEPAAPLLWAVIGNQRAAPFGRVLPIDPHS